MGTSVPKLEFWYEFASTYSYLSAMRIEEMAQGRGVEIEWKPFLLGPIFKDQGWSTSPFRLFPAKGKYMMRDLQRLAEARGLQFSLPDPFPPNSLAAARLAVIGSAEGWVARFTRAVYAAEFASHDDIAGRAVLSRILERLNLDAARLLAAIDEPAVKERLRDQTTEAKSRGIFGAPSFVVDGELFWGDDRLEQALVWAARPPVA